MADPSHHVTRFPFFLCLVIVLLCCSGVELTPGRPTHRTRSLLSSSSPLSSRSSSLAETIEPGSPPAASGSRRGDSNGDESWTQNYWTSRKGKRKRGSRRFTTSHGRSSSLDSDDQKWIVSSSASSMDLASPRSRSHLPSSPYYMKRNPDPDTTNSLANMPHGILDNIVSFLPTRDLGKLRSAAKIFHPATGIVTKVREVFASWYPGQDSTDLYLLSRFCLFDVSNSAFGRELKGAKGMKLPYEGSSVACLIALENDVSVSASRDPLEPVYLQMIYEIIDEDREGGSLADLSTVSYLLRSLDKWPVSLRRALLYFVMNHQNASQLFWKAWSVGCSWHGKSMFSLESYPKECRVSLLWVVHYRHELFDELSTHLSTKTIFDIQSFESFERELVAFHHANFMLCEAVLSRRVDEAFALLDSGSGSIHADCNRSVSLDPIGPVFHTYLTKAFNQPESVISNLEKLVELGAYINFASKSTMENALFWMIRLSPSLPAYSYQIDMCKFALARGMKANPVNLIHETPLILASEMGADGIVQVLLRYNASVNYRRYPHYDGKTPLMIAARHSPKIVKMLLDHGADVDIRADYGEIALFFAENMESFHLLLAHGSNFKHIDLTGDTFLINAMRHGHRRIIMAILQLFIQHAPELINHQNLHGQSAIMLCTHERVLRTLLNAGASTALQDIPKNSALHYFAAAVGSLPLVKLILDHGANVNAINRHGRTPLMSCRTPEAARLLLLHGANISAVDSFGDTAIMGYSRTAKDIILRVVLENLDDLSILNHQNKVGQTALMLAANSDVGKVLLEAGADPNVKDGPGGQNALMFAIHKRGERLVRLLLKYGADVTIVDNHGISAFDYAFSEVGPISGITRMIHRALGKVRSGSG